MRPRMGKLTGLAEKSASGGNFWSEWMHPTADVSLAFPAGGGGACFAYRRALVGSLRFLISSNC